MVILERQSSFSLGIPRTAFEFVVGHIASGDDNEWRTKLFPFEFRRILAILDVIVLSFVMIAKFSSSFVKILVSTPLLSSKLGSSFTVSSSARPTRKCAIKKIEWVIR